MRHLLEHAEHRGSPRTGRLLRDRNGWAWPKPKQRPRPPILVGAAGTEKTFAWIVCSADGWITPPIERDIDSGVRQLATMWREAGRSGEPRVVVLADEPDPDTLRHWREIGVAEVVFSLPDADTDEVHGFIEQLARKLEGQR